MGALVQKKKKWRRGKAEQGRQCLIAVPTRGSEFGQRAASFWERGNDELGASLVCVCWPTSLSGPAPGLVNCGLIVENFSGIPAVDSTPTTTTTSRLARHGAISFGAMKCWRKVGVARPVSCTRTPRRPKTAQAGVGTVLYCAYISYSTVPILPEDRCARCRRTWPPIGVCSPSPRVCGAAHMQSRLYSRERGWQPSAVGGAVQRRRNLALRHQSAGARVRRIGGA